MTSASIHRAGIRRLSEVGHRGTARPFELERRLYRIESWALPVPGGIRLSSLAWFGGALVLVAMLGELPVVGDVLGLIPPPLRFLVLPAAIAMLAGRPGPDGLSPVTAALAWLLFRLRR